MIHYYEIRIRGHLDQSWADWFEGITIRHEDNGETLISGALPDQAALHGLLNRLRDLNVHLISVSATETPRACRAAHDEDEAP